MCVLVTVVPDLDALLRTQDGLIHHGQLADVGITRAALRWRLGSGRWREVLPGVYLSVNGTPTPRQQVLAACLYAGRQAQLTGVAALRLHGLRHLPSDPWIRLLVPHSRHVPPADPVRVHRTRRMDAYAQPVGFAEVCCVARAVADAARWCPTPRAVRALVAEAVQRRLATMDHLRRELDEGPRAGGALLRRALTEVTAGALPAPEAELREILSRSVVLPAISWNALLVGLADGQPLPTPDGWIDETGVALEVDSRECHLTPADWERTMHRHNRLAEYGALVLHFPPSRIRLDPHGVVQVVERVYLERLRSRARAAIRALAP